ncbi:MAG: polysaccharide deacetylase family protein [Deltaproteobacteria bacterium]|nr:polysaccharide deacetylase family protein [Deltaproteobacteria bacterium]
MARNIPILTFHDISKKKSVISFAPELFERSMSLLSRHGYKTFRLMEISEWQGIREPFPDRALIITFDDGYKSVFDNAFQVLKRYGMTATVFLTTGEKKSARDGGRLPSINDSLMLSWEEIRGMHAQGIDFGAHTLTHQDLTRVSLKEAENEIYRSKAIIEEILNAPVPCFAYPFGKYNHEIYRIVRRHFSCACTDRLGLINLKSDPYTLDRVDSYYLRSDSSFKLIFTGLFPLYIKARSIPRNIRRSFAEYLR